MSASNKLIQHNSGVRSQNKKLEGDSHPSQLKTSYKEGVLNPLTQKSKIQEYIRFLFFSSNF